MNLCVAIILFSMVFLIGSEKRSFTSKTECAIAAGFLHYFLLAIFAWCTAEAFHSVRGLVFPMKSEITKFIYKAMAICWGKFLKLHSYLF